MKTSRDVDVMYWREGLSLVVAMQCMLWNDHQHMWAGQFLQTYTKYLPDFLTLHVKLTRQTYSNLHTCGLSPFNEKKKVINHGTLHPFPPHTATNTTCWKTKMILLRQVTVSDLLTATQHHYRNTANRLVGFICNWVKIISPEVTLRSAGAGQTSPRLSCSVLPPTFREGCGPVRISTEENV